jgi:hypothetical protein
MRIFLTAALLVAAASSSYADIVLLGPAPTGGAGLGNRSTVLTLQSPASSSSEEGCVGLNQSTAGCGFSDATVLQGAGQIGTYTMGDLGLTSFSDLRIMFNAAQPGNAEDVTLNQLVLTLYNTAAQTTSVYSLSPAPVTLDATFLGIGQEGFIFGLDGTQAAIANIFAGGNSGIVLGLGASLDGATGGPDTFSFAVATPGGDETVPEPSTYMMLAGGLVALVGAKRFRKAS